MGDVKFEVVRHQLTSGDSGTIDITKSGFGTPKAALFFYNGATANATLTADAVLGFGFTDGTTDYGNYNVSENGQATSDTHRGSGSSCIRAFLGDTTAIDCRYTFSSWITDGVRLTVNDAPAGNRYVIVVLIGGADVLDAYVGSDNLAGAADKDVTAPGAPASGAWNMVFCSGVDRDALDDSGQSRGFFGVAYDNGTTVEQGGISQYAQNSQATSVTGSRISSTRAVTHYNNVGDYAYEIKAFDSSGFTFGYNGGEGNSTSKVGYLILAIDSAHDIKVFGFDSPTSTGSTSVTDPGFEPGFGLVFANSATAYSTNTNRNTASSIAFDADNCYTSATHDENGVTTTNAESYSSTNLTVLNEAGGNQHVASFTEFTATGWTFNYTTVDATARKWVGLAVGTSAASGSYTLAADSGSYTLTGTAAALTAARALAGGSGAYSLTGTAASLLAGRVVTAASGSYTFTGTDATLTYTPASGAYTLVADSGSYTLSGTAAALTADRVIAASSGSYSLTGTAAALNRGYHLTAGSGAYSLTGTNIAFSVSRVLSAGSGSYTLTGTAATLDYSSLTVWTVQTKDTSTWSEQTDDLSTWTVQ